MKFIKHLTLFIDILIFLGFTIVLVINISFDYNFFITNELVLQIITTLLPLIITTLAISVSLKNDKVHGVTLNDFNKIRKGYYFNFFHIFIIAMVIYFYFGLISILPYQLDFSLLVLVVISFLYLIYFVICDIPILINNEKAIVITLRLAYKYKAFLLKREEIEEVNEFENILDVITLNIILNEGIDSGKKLFSSLKDENIDIIYKYTLNKFGISNENSNDLSDSEHKVLMILMIIENLYFENLINDLKLVNLNNEIYQGIQLSKGIENGYDNLVFVISRSNVSKSSADLYIIHSNFVTLHNVTKEFGYKDLEDYGISKIFNKLYYEFDSDKSSLSSVSALKLLISLTYSSLFNNEMWFVEGMISNLYIFEKIFNEKNKMAITLISILIFLCSSKLGKKNHLLLKNLLIKKFEYTGIESWMKNFKDILQSSYFELSFYDDAIEFLNSAYGSNSILFEFHGHISALTYSFLLNEYFDSLFFLDPELIKKEGVVEKIKKDYEDYINNYSEGKFHIEDLRKKSNSEFLNFYRTSSNGFNEKLYNYLILNRPYKDNFSFKEAIERKEKAILEMVKNKMNEVIKCFTVRCKHVGNLDLDVSIFSHLKDMSLNIAEEVEKIKHLKNYIEEELNGILYAYFEKYVDIKDDLYNSPDDFYDILPNFPDKEDSFKFEIESEDDYDKDGYDDYESYKETVLQNNLDFEFEEYLIEDSEFNSSFSKTDYENDNDMIFNIDIEILGSESVKPDNEIIEEYMKHNFYPSNGIFKYETYFSGERNVYFLNEKELFKKLEENLFSLVIKFKFKLTNERPDM